MRIIAACIENRFLHPLDRENATDEALIKRAGAGDKTAAAMLVERHTDKIFAVCWRMLKRRDAAEDATQETFLKVWRNAARWKSKGARVDTWIYRIAMNVCLDQLRKTKREAPEEAAPEQIDSAPRPDEVLLMGERRALIDQAMMDLPPRQRLAVTLCHFQELSNIEAAAVMNVSVDALESLLSRGRRGLRDRLSPVKSSVTGRMSDEPTANVN